MKIVFYVVLLAPHLPLPAWLTLPETNTPNAAE